MKKHQVTSHLFEKCIPLCIIKLSHPILLQYHVSDESAEGFSFLRSLLRFGSFILWLSLLWDLYYSFLSSLTGSIMVQQQQRLFLRPHTIQFSQINSVTSHFIEKILLSTQKTKYNSFKIRKTKEMNFPVCVANSKPEQHQKPNSIDVNFQSLHTPFSVYFLKLRMNHLMSTSVFGQHFWRHSCNVYNRL